MDWGAALNKAQQAPSFLPEGGARGPERPRDRRAAEGLPESQCARGEDKRRQQSDQEALMNKIVKLKDQTELLIRDMTLGDLEASLAFFRALPDEDRAYLRRDVARREVVAQRLREINSDTVKRLVAVADDQIVADGSLELAVEEWKKHVGELRLVVASAYQRQGLGVRMARELYELAAGEKVEEIIVKMMRPQKAARSIFQRLGFTEEAVLPDYVKDASGRKQDLILARCDLEALWRKMEDFVALSDWVRTQ